MRQILEGMPPGDYRVQDKKVTPPPRGRIDESMEALIHHFKIFTEGFKVPAGEAYVATENPLGVMGYYVVSKGDLGPFRVKIRSASFNNISVTPWVMRGVYVPDVITILASLYFILGDIDR